MPGWRRKGSRAPLSPAAPPAPLPLARLGPGGLTRRHAAASLSEESWGWRQPCQTQHSAPQHPHSMAHPPLSIRAPSHPFSSRRACEHGQCTAGWAKASKIQLTSHLSPLNTWAQDQHVMSMHFHVSAPFFPYGTKAENKPPHFSKKGTKSNLELSRLVATYSSSWFTLLHIISL